MAQPAPDLPGQAAALRAYALDQVAATRPGWTEENRALWAGAFETAVLKHAREPLSEAHLGELQKAIARCAETSTEKPPGAWFLSAAMVYDFIVGDIISTPPPDPAEVAGLKAQVSELSTYTAQQLVERMGVLAEAAEAAAGKAEALYLERIDEPKYRFNRKPMTEEQMQAARADVCTAIDEMAREFAGLHAALGGAPAGAAETLAELGVERTAHHALYVVAHKYWSWRDPPKTEERQEASRRSAEASQALIGASKLAGRIDPVAHLLVAAAVDGDPVASCLRASPGALSPDEGASVGLLRHPLGSAKAVACTADVQFVSAEATRQGPCHFEVRYSVTPGAVRAEISIAPDPALAPDDRLAGATVIYEVGPDGVRVLSSAGDVVAVGGPAQAPARRERGQPPKPPWEVPVPRDDLQGLARLPDPGAFQWRVQAELPHKSQVLGAQLDRPMDLAGIGTLTSLRYRFLPAANGLEHSTAYGPGGEVLWDTVYDDFQELAGGWHAALRSTTTFSATVLARRPQGVHRPAPFLAGLGCAAHRIITEYKCLPEGNVRVPLRRFIYDELGRLECVMEFRDHKVEPAGPQ